MTRSFAAVLLLLSVQGSAGFVSNQNQRQITSLFQSTTAADGELALQKKKLLGLLLTEPEEDPVLADPITKQRVTIATRSAVLGGESKGGNIKLRLKSESNTFAGSSDSFLNLLQPEKPAESAKESSNNRVRDAFLKSLGPFIPPPLQSPLATAGLPMGTDYVPMRDLFTSPAVSYAYERGWRQNFRTAGFPGSDREAELAMEYFEPAMPRSSSKVLVDMSCATGLFTRCFAKQEWKVQSCAGL